MRELYVASRSIARVSTLVTGGNEAGEKRRQGKHKHIKCAQASRARAAPTAKMAHYAVLLLHIICMTEEEVERGRSREGGRGMGGEGEKMHL